MKCGNCGKNEAVFFTRTNINGHIEEKQLCMECAEKLGYTQRLAAREHRSMRDVFSDMLEEFFSSPSGMLGGRSAWMLDDPFDDFFADMPALITGPVRTRTAAAEPQKADLVSREEQGRFDRMRQVNALRLELKKAVRQENFEHAAELRDQIRALEAQEKND